MWTSVVVFWSRVSMSPSLKWDAQGKSGRVICYYVLKEKVSPAWQVVTFNSSPACQVVKATEHTFCLRLRLQALQSWVSAHGTRYSCIPR